jgi:hypothetical protein
METKKVYEYVMVKEWLDNLEKGTRLYFDYDKQGYIYHYETERTYKNNNYDMESFSSEDYFISVDVANRNILNEKLIAGPELGELEYKK